MKKRIEDAVVRVETTTSSALEMEEAQRIKQEEVLQKRNLWDNLTKSHETLSALADAIRVVDHLKDLRFKVISMQYFELNKQFLFSRFEQTKHMLNYVYSVTFIRQIVYICNLTFALILCTETMLAICNFAFF